VDAVFLETGTGSVRGTIGIIGELTTEGEARNLSFLNRDPFLLKACVPDGFIRSALALEAAVCDGEKGWTAA
jgi:hypothetical protein